MPLIHDVARRQALKKLAAFGAAATCLPQALAEDKSTLQWIVPYAAGAASDILTRYLAKAVGERLQVPVVVDNVVGGGSALGASKLARQKPHGHCVGTLDVAGLAVLPSIQPKLAYDPINSFTPISLAWRIPFVLVTAREDLKNLAAFKAQALASAQPLTYASAGIGSAIHLAMALLEQASGLSLSHVPYKGAAPALQDVLAQRVDAMFISLGAAAAHLSSGKLYAIGASGRTRFAQAPDIPTLDELGLQGFEASSWQGVLGPAGMSAEQVDRIHAAIVQAAAQPELVRFFAQAGAQVETQTPEAFGHYIQQEIKKWSEIIRVKNIVLEA